mmetsp:Transcript_13777/g.20292  ORF Transcript_13777/g.20292 Transcript_13777/m.20292 type:complete len:227 (-) Transcript_13777:714-1394(-)
MPQPSISTCCHQCKPLPFSVQSVRSSGEQTGSGGPKRVAQRQRPAMDVQLFHGHLPQLAGAPGQPVRSKLVGVHGSQVCQHLPSKGLVNFKHVDVIQGKSCIRQDLGAGVGRPQQQLLKGVNSHKVEGPEGGLGLQPQSQGPRLRANQTGRGPVRQKGGVGGRVGPVRLHEGGLQLAQPLQGGVGLDAVFLRAAVHRHDFRLVDPAGVGLGRPLVGAEGKPVLVFP